MRTLNDIADIAKGKVGFIVGAGPSLHFQDVEPLRDHLTIAVNAGIVKVPFCSFFVTDDQDVANWSYYMGLKSLDCDCLLYESKIRGRDSHIPENRKIWFQHKLWYEPSKKKYHKDGLVITKDPNLPIIGARTSGGTAIHLAHIMGCDPIVLLGTDCCYREGKRYFWQFEGENKPYRLDNKSVECNPTRKINGQQADWHSGEFLEYYNSLATQCRSQNIRIINVSGGILDCFERMTLVEVLESFAGR